MTRDHSWRTLVGVASATAFLLLMLYVLSSCAPPYPYGTQIVITPTPQIQATPRSTTTEPEGMDWNRVKRYYDVEYGVVCYESHQLLLGDGLNGWSCVRVN